MFRIDSLTYCYPKAVRPVISGLDMELKPGGNYGLLGSNGAGKCTLLYLMGGLLRPQFGSVEFDGVSVWSRQPSTLADIFLVPEEFSLPSVRLDEFVRVNSPFYPRFSQEEMERYLLQFKLDPQIHLGRLSMGQKKKVFIAFALACNTSLLLMDEPTNGLDIPGKSEFRRTLVSAMSDERTVVISTHQVRDLDRVLDHVLMMGRGDVLINAQVSLIQNRLRFELMPSPQQLSASVLYCETVPGGYSVVSVNDSPDTETDVNLESLFEFAVSNPETIKRILS